MTYPQLPQTIINVQNTAPKLDVDEMMDVWDAFSKLGVALIPKQRWVKFAHTDFTRGGYQLVDRETALKYQSKATVSGWVALPFMSERSYVIIDLDTECNVAETYEKIQKLCPTQMVYTTPSGGVHLWYEGDCEINPNPHKGVEVRTKSVRSPITIAGTAHYLGDTAAKKGVPEGHLGHYTLIGSMNPSTANEALLSFLQGDVKVVEPFKATATGNSVVANHEALSQDDKVAVVMEALGYALRSAMDYTLWVSIWMSAWAGCDGDDRVMQHILDHPNVEWSDGQKGRDKFQKDWSTHIPKEGGYTVATLFYKAYENGWLTRSAAEVPLGSGDTISVARISEWITSLQTLPKNLLLMSQTGSGKTYGFKAVYERLGEPKTVVIVPTARLALDMAKKLETLGLPATAYRDQSSLEIKSAGVLADSRILVTTLQTFTNRLFVENENYLDRYGLVWLEECDQLIIAFARSLGEDASHVDHQQAVQGFAMLREAFASKAHVWGVDATATMVSYHAFSRLCGDFRFVKNTFVHPKPPVRWLKDRLGAYSVIASKLSEGKTVVVPCDTKKEAETVVDVMVRLQLVPANAALAVTADTGATDPRVAQYSGDANTYARLYKLVTYNSAMASGVSVDEFEPDVVVQIATGYLPPRVNLQLLNRYRKQAEVFVWYNTKKGVSVARKVSAELEKARTNVSSEAEYANLTVADRAENAQVRDELRTLAQIDEYDQRRNPALFYRGLLSVNDGRMSVDESMVVIAAVEAAEEGAKEARAEFIEDIAMNWVTVEPYSDPAFMPKEYSANQVRYSLAHYWLKTQLNGNTPDHENPDYVYRVVRRLHRKTGALTAFVKQAEAVRRLEKAYANSERGLLTLPPTVCRVVLAASLRYLFDEPDSVLSHEELQHRALPYMRYLEDNAALYHAVVKTPDGSLSAIKERTDDVVQQVVSCIKRIGSHIGLKIRSRSMAGYRIENLQEVNDYLSWYYDEPISVRFERQELDAERAKRSKYKRLIQEMDNDKRAAFYKRLTVLPLEIALDGRL